MFCMMENKLRITFLIFFLCGFLAISSEAQNCKYDNNGVREIPTYNQVVSLVGINVKMVKGKVIDWRGKVVPKSIVSLHKKTKKGLVFVGSIVVGEDGKYCFKNIPNGKYVIKGGFDGFNRTEVEFNLNPRNRKAKKQLDITLEVGT